MLRRRQISSAALHAVAVNVDATRIGNSFPQRHLICGGNKLSQERQAPRTRLTSYICSLSGYFGTCDEDCYKNLWLTPPCSIQPVIR